MSTKKTAKSASKPKTAAKAKTAKKTATAKGSVSPKEAAEPLMVSTAAESASTRSRRNASSTIVRSDRFRNIEDGMVPFKYSTGGVGGNTSAIDVRDTVKLCQKAYYNFSIFRSTIDMMTEFSVNNIYFRGGSKKSRKFLEALFKKINLKSFMDKFFREYYRSGNVFIYRFASSLKEEDLKKITQTFGAKGLLDEDSGTLPSRYMILNPADIKLTGSLSFSTGRYSKLVSDYELQRLRNPESEEDLEVLNNLPEQTRKALDSRATQVMIPLDPDKIAGVFYKKQDYEPFAVPMGYPVLEDINAKYEMKKIDMAIARTMQQAILLVTMGTDPDKGGVNQKNLAAMQTLFTNESVGRVLIADYTTKAEFVVPRIADLLTPSKYEIFDRDIRMGLNNILFGEGEKFADTSVKVKIFIERLKQARETFIDEFLFPEIKTICKNLGFKNYPTPYFEDIDLRDGLSYARIYTRLVELGLLTQEEAVSALETGKLPTTEESIESQEKFKKLKDSGLYQPIIGGAKTETEDEDEEDEEDVKKPNGRPEGSDGNPQEVEREPSDNMDSAPTINATELYSLEKIKSNLILAGQLNSEVEKSLREKHSVKRMTNKQKEVAQGITELIMANENPEDWKSKINIYIENPKDSNKERVNDINEIAAKHQVDSYLASILRASTKE
jgi:hypothetical protein